MTPTSESIEESLMRIEGAFRDNPSLTITASQAQRRFSVDAGLCEGILVALHRAGVLAKTPEGAYMRFFPRFAIEAERRIPRPGLSTRSQLPRNTS